MKSIGYERILTSGDYDHQLTCTNVFSCDSAEILYDTRTRGRNQDESVIESVSCDTGNIRLVYKNDTGARGCGEACWAPVSPWMRARPSPPGVAN